MTPADQIRQIFQFDSELAARVVDFASQYTFLFIHSLPTNPPPDVTLTDHVTHTEQNPEHRSLVKNVMDYCYTVMSPEYRARVGEYEVTSEEPASKKRKIDPSDTSVQYPGSVKKPTPSTSYVRDEETEHLLFSAEASFAVPVRKKLSVSFYQSAKEGPGYGGLEVKGGDVRYGFRWADIDHAFLLPAPEKAQRAQNFVVILNRKEKEEDQFMWTVPETVPKGMNLPEGETLVTVMRRTIDAQLKPHGKAVTIPEDDEFASAVVQSHRKGEAAYHVKAFVGSKDGFLFFLSTGILWGFRKPLSFYPFSAIESISYTSVLQRTFNLVIATNPSPAGEPGQSVEFSMIDQLDFAGIDAYVKNHGLNDASMARERMAKKYNVNAPKKGDVNGEANGDAGDGVGDDGLTELQRAEQQIQDAEDEEEEDYDPSGGESEGEGEDSGEEDDGGGVNEAGLEDGEAEDMEEQEEYEDDGDE
ncbi:hypothetical protein MBLNU457_3290t1 [Dothideomycetes sp. NU457]